MSNLKQLGLAVMMYVQDYDETYPADYNGATSLPFNDRFWEGIIYPYYKDYALLTCPSTPITVQIPTYGVYGANSGMLKNAYAPSTSQPQVNAGSIKLSAVVSPSTTYMLMDAPYYTISPTDAVTPSSYHNYLPGMGQIGGNCSATNGYSGYDSDCQSGRHFGGVNVTFADGHVKWVKSQIAREEAIKCGSRTYLHVNCMDSHYIPSIESAWNPFADNQ